MKRLLALALAVLASNAGLAAQSKSAPTRSVPTVAKTNLGEEFSKRALRALFLINANQNTALTDQERGAVGGLWYAKLSLYGPDGTRRKNVNATRGEQLDAEQQVYDTFKGLEAHARKGPLKENCVAEIRAQLQARNWTEPSKPCQFISDFDRYFGPFPHSN